MTPVFLLKQCREYLYLAYITSLSEYSSHDKGVERILQI